MDSIYATVRRMKAKQPMDRPSLKQLVETSKLWGVMRNAGGSPPQHGVGAEAGGREPLAPAKARFVAGYSRNFGAGPRELR